MTLDASSSTHIPTALVTPSSAFKPPCINNEPYEPLIDPKSGVELKRHTDLWFEDGSVICRAENILFRVHMSQLARHSICFRDMFTLASASRHHATSTSSSSVDGNGNIDRLDDCPVILLHDKAKDVANLFTALYDGPNFGSNDQEDFRVVSGVLRLATKYIIDSLREKALAHLTIAWPPTLKAWDAREDLARCYEMETGLSVGHLYPSPIEVICLAREVDAPMLLPSAFYDLCRYPFSQMFEPSEEDPLFRSSSPMLSAIDMQHLCLGKEAAQHAITSMIQAMGNSQSIRLAQNNGPHMGHSRRHSAGGICITAAACRKDFSELVDLATQHYLFDRERGFCDPLYVAEELGQLKSAEFSECKPCARSLEAWAAREREKMWKLIPSWFRLELPPPDASPRAHD